MLPRSWSRSWARLWPGLWLGLIALGINPSHAYVTVLGSLDREWQVQAGDQHHGQIEVHNPSARTVRMRAYLKDFDPRPDGLGFQPPPAHDRSNAAWITLMPAEQVIEAGARAVVNFTIDVPSELQQEGSAWSIIMIEAVPHGHEAGQARQVATDPAQVTMDIRHVLRTAVRVVTTSGGQLGLAFVERSLVADADEQAMTLVLRNDGNRSLHLALHADLFDDRGQSVGRIVPRQSVTRLLPGAQVARRLHLPELPSGDYQAIVIADHRGAHLFGARYSFHLPSSEINQAVP